MCSKFTVCKNCSSVSSKQKQYYEAMNSRSCNLKITLEKCSRIYGDRELQVEARNSMFVKF